MSAKSKWFVLGVLGIAVITAIVLVFPLSSGAAISKSVFPKTLNGLPLASLEEQSPDEEIAEGLSAYYGTEESTTEIMVLFWRTRTGEIAEETVEDIIPGLQMEYDSLFDYVEWETPQRVSLKGQQATATTFRAYSQGNYLDGGVIFLAIRDYFIFVQIVNYEKTPSLSELKNALGIFIDKVPGLEVKGCTDSEAINYNPKASVDDGSCTYEELGAVCGDDNCEYWEKENCKNCVQDCRLSGFCCLPGYSYIYAHDYHDKKYHKIHKAPGGVIPEAAFLIPEGMGKDDLPLALPSMCYQEGMVTGECIKNWDCSSGVCTVDHWCIKTRTEKDEMFQEIKDEKIVEKIYEDQTSYREEYVEAYEMIEGGIAQIVIKEAKLDVRLEVQGNTAGKIPKVNEDDEIEVRLEITNESKYQLALAAGIFYPEAFDLEEKKYTISFDWEGGLSSLIGSFKTKLIGGKFIVMPSGSKLIVYSKVVPKQTGYLDVQGLVFFTTEKKYRKYDPGFLNETPKAYQESEVSETILVEERPCDWWPICL